VHAAPTDGPVATAADAAGQFTTSFGVAGMTCSHCVSSVTEELASLAGVTAVQVEIVAGGVSTVTVRSAGALDERDEQRQRVVEEQRLGQAKLGDHEVVAIHGGQADRAAYDVLAQVQRLQLPQPARQDGQARQR
jgi:copper chaperone CopZ